MKLTTANKNLLLDAYDGDITKRIAPTDEEAKDVLRSLETMGLVEVRLDGNPWCDSWWGFRGRITPSGALLAGYLYVNDPLGGGYEGA